MTIEKNQNGSERTIALTCRLNTIHAPQLEAELKATLPGIEHLVPDFTKLDYLSSAGLRILLGAQKQMNRQGNMFVRKHNLITNRSDGLTEKANPKNQVMPMLFSFLTF